MKFNFQSVLALSFFFSVFHIQSQNNSSQNGQKFEVSIYITDSLKNSIPIVNVFFKNVVSSEEYFYTMDHSKEFQTFLPSGQYNLVISAQKYADYNTIFSLSENQKLPKVTLFEKSIILDEIIISAKITRKIKQNATGLIIDLKNDTIFRDVTVNEILPYLPSVQVDNQGNFLLQGEQAKVIIDGKLQELSKETLASKLLNLKGLNVQNIELIQTPSAKYDASIKKIININTKKDREDGINGSVSNRITNSDLSILSSSAIDYKIKKTIVNFNMTPFSYNRKSVETITTRRLLDNSLFFNENIDKIDKNNSKSYNLGLDYTINSNHSFYLNYGLSNSKWRSSIMFNSEKFSFETLETTFFSDSKTLNNSKTDIANFGYRYDIGQKNARLDLAASYENHNENNEKDLKNLELFPNSNNNIDVKNIDEVLNQVDAFSSRIDFSLPLKDSNKKFEAGIKYDILNISNSNIFKKFNSETDNYEADPNFSNQFKYKENKFSLYTSLDNNRNRLKYSIGFRLENILTNSHSIDINLKTENSFFNFLPIISLKYITNKAETNNISLSYRKGYILPPYLQLNPFENFINNNTIQRGNPNLTQSIYHSFNLGYTLKNKYFFSFNIYNYTDYFASTEILVNEQNIISYENIGNKNSYRFTFYSNHVFYKWWRIYLNVSLDYKLTKSQRIHTAIANYFFSSTNMFNLLNDYRISLITSFSNGNSSNFEIPNSFLRFYSSITFSKLLLNKKLSLGIRAIDLFAVNNKDISTYIIDNTEYSNRNLFQSPKIFFDITYRFNSGKKIDNKNKKKSSIDEGRF